ncbi:MAG: rod-binding protein [Armatimonadota bacterium]
MMQQGATVDTDAQTLEVCRQFEALVVSRLLKEMRESVPGDGLIPRSSGEELFQEMLDNEYAIQISRLSPFGLASALYQQLSPASPAPPQMDHAS